MENKPSMSRVERLHREKVTRYSIRKYSFGAASVAVAALFMFLGNGAVSVQADQIQPGDTAVAPSATPTLDKAQLESYISEIETKLSNGSYDNKTEESVALLKADLEAAKTTLANATTQAELTKAYRKLFLTANSKLRSKPVEKKETPAVDTTEGKETVGKSAENTEPKAGTNSIENTGSKDERNGKELDKNNDFRTVNTKSKNTIYSTDSEITGTGTPGATVKVTVKNPEGTTVISEETTTVGADGNWKLALDKGLNSNEALFGASEAARTFYAPKNKVEVTQTVNGVESEKADLEVSIGESKILPSEAAKDKTSVVAGAKKVVLTVPHDTGYSYFWYKDKETNSAPQVTLKRGEDRGWSITENPERATIESVDHGKFVDTITLTLTKPVAEGNNNIQIISHNGSASHGSFSGKYSVNVTNEAPVVSSATGSDETVVPMGGNVDLSTLAKVTDHEDDQNATLGAKGTATVVSINGDTNKTTLEAADFGVGGTTHTVQYKAVDSQGKESAVYTHTIKVQGAAPAVNTKSKNTIYSTDSEITGTGTPGATVKVTVKNPEGTTVISEETTTVGADGNWKLALDKGLNSNEALFGASEAARTFYAPKNKVEVTQTVNGVESEKADLEVSIGESKILPSEAAKDKTSVVAGAKKVVLTVPHDTGYSYFWYKDKETNSAPQVTLKRGEDRGWSITENPERATIESVDHGKFVDTITLTLTKPVAEGNNNIQIISHNGSASHGSFSGKYSVNVTNEKPTLASKNGQTETTVNVGDNVNPASLVTVADHEDDKDATLGTKVRAEVISVNGDESVKTVDTTTAGSYVVKYKAIDSQGKESDELTHTVIVNLDKQPAINAVEQAAIAQIEKINGNKAATKEEKDAAIAKVNNDKKAALDAINADTVKTQDALTQAQNAGTDAIAKDNPVVAAKPEAKKAVDDALKAKEAAIDARTDLTDDDKKAAKDAAKAAADKAKEAVDAATTDAEVTKAKEAGTKAVADVTPVAKAEAKKAIAKALEDKNSEIDKRTDLTDEEKTAAKKEAKDKADAQLAKINEQPDAAATPAAAKTAQDAVDAAKKTGVAEVTAVNPVAVKKPAAKKAIDDALKAKEAAIDARPDLTDDEKKAAKEEAKAAAEKAKAAVDAATTDAAVDAAKKSGVDEVAAVNPEAVTKPAAKKAIEDKLAKQLEDIANTPDATDEEKAAAAEKAKAAAEAAKAAVDKATTDAAVKAEKDKAVGEGDTKGTIDELPVVEDKPNARKAIDEEATAKKAEIDARNDLTPKAKAKLKAKADKVAEKAKAAIDAVTSVEDVNTIEEADKAAIKAIGDINRPIDKVLVKDPSALTDEEKAKVLEEVKKVNPTAKEVKYDENGNIEVTTEAGDKGIINPTKLVKTEDQLDNGKGGNDIHKPLDKVLVKDPSALTDEEKAKIVAKVEEVNPDAIVTIDENGTVSVSTSDGKTAAIPASDLVRTKEDTAKAGAGNSNIVKPADKVVGEANDPDDQAKVEAKLRELNPETKSVKFDEDGNATVTLKDGTTATIPSEDLFRSEADATTPNAGNDIVNPADKTVVANPAKLTDAEKKAIEDKVKAVNPGATVVVDDKGNATVTTPEGKTAVIPATDLTKSAADAAKPEAGNNVNKPADKTAVKDPANLTPEEKKAIEDKVKAVNPDATVAVDDKGNATVTTPEGKTAVIPAADLTKDPEAATKPNAGNDIVKPADKTVVANPEKLTDAEKKAIEDKVKAVNPDATVVVDDKGNATVTTPEGKTAVIPAADLTKDPEAATKPNAGNDIVKPADKTVVANPEKLTDAEKKA
ncbi:DUF1542 domain-containing protein, partial [Streptococcus mitis]|uniref:DUF1542 domain-containing protein n=1 Tax=Streptococcus mitis TaxID=28037 RepID=UPI0021B7FE45